MHEARDAFISGLKATTGSFPDLETFVRRIYEAFLREGDRALDVGVNEGHHLVNMATAVGASGKIIGIEAYKPILWQTLGNIVQYHPRLVDRIEILNVAVSNEPGTAQFYFDKSFTGLSSLARRDVSEGHEIEPTIVKLDTLDNLISEPVRFIKIDIEGAEYHALRGAGKLLQSKPLIAFEFDPSAPRYFEYDPRDFVGLFDAAGYQITDLFGHPHPDAESLMNSPTWNFLAIPNGLDATTVCAPARGH